MGRSAELRQKKGNSDENPDFLFCFAYFSYFIVFLISVVLGIPVFLIPVLVVCYRCFVMSYQLRHSTVPTVYFFAQSYFCGLREASSDGES